MTFSGHFFFFFGFSRLLVLPAYGCFCVCVGTLYVLVISSGHLFLRLVEAAGLYSQWRTLLFAIGKEKIVSTVTGADGKIWEATEVYRGV